MTVAPRRAALFACVATLGGAGGGLLTGRHDVGRAATTTDTTFPVHAPREGGLTVDIRPPVSVKGRVVMDLVASRRFVNRRHLVLTTTILVGQRRQRCPSSVSRITQRLRLVSSDVRDGFHVRRVEELRHGGEYAVCVYLDAAHARAVARSAMFFRL